MRWRRRKIHPRGGSGGVDSTGKEERQVTYWRNRKCWCVLRGDSKIKSRQCIGPGGQGQGHMELQSFKNSCDFIPWAMECQVSITIWFIFFKAYSDCLVENGFGEILGRRWLSKPSFVVLLHNNFCHCPQTTWDQKINLRVLKFSLGCFKKLLCCLFSVYFAGRGGHLLLSLWNYRWLTRMKVQKRFFS